jgi:hypothetical protein
MKKLILIIYALLAIATMMNAQQNNFPKLTGHYLGQQPPGSTPEIFAHEILSSQLHPHGSLAFSNDGRSIYWSAMLKDGPQQTIFCSEFDWKSLSMPRKADFAADSGNGGPAFSADGKRIYFSLIMPAINQQVNKPTAICFTEWNNARWSSPVVIEITIDTIMTKGQVSIARSGNIYFSGRKYDERMPSIYVCRNEGGKILAPEKIKGKILEAGLIVDPWIDPDEKYLLVSCQPEQGPPMRTDIGISFREADGSWGKPIRLDARINTPDFERFASITPDGKYLFFIRSASQRFVGDGAHFYWVSANVIEELRPKE